MRNRIIALLLILSFCFAVPVLAESQELFSAIELTPFAGDTITRAEFTAKVAGVLKLTYGGERDRYTDIDGHEYHDQICAALAAGLIAPADKFNPDDAILTIDAYRVALAATGWVPRVKSMGGKDADYLLLAGRLYMTDGITGDPYAPLNTEDSNTLLWNMLHCDIQEQTVFGDKVAYKSREGNNLLSALYHIEQTTGIVTATEYTGLNAADGAVDKGRIKIGSVEYIAENRQDFLGKNVRAYYIADGPQGKNVIVALQQEDTQELTVDGRQIEKIEDRKLSYYTGERVKTVRLAESFSCIKNGKKLDLYTGDLKALFTESLDTELTLIDADQDSKYETVLMTVRQYCYVEALDDNGMFYDKHQVTNNIDLSGTDIQYRFLNQEMGIEDIKPGMLLTFTRSDDGQILTIETEYSIVEGAIEVSYPGEKALVINGQRYEWTDYYNKNFSSLTVGKKGMFLLDGRGRLVAYDTDLETMMYGWIMAMAETGTFDTTLSVKIFTQNNRVEIYNFANKVSLDGADPEKISEDIIVNNLKPDNRLVKFKRNQDGVISEMYFPKAVTKFEDAQAQDNQFLQYHDGTYRWQSDTKTFLEGFVVDSGTFLFVVPEEKALRAEEQNFNVFSGASSNFSSTSSYPVTSFDVSDEGVASVVLYLSDVYTVTDTVCMPRSRDGYAWVVEEKCYGRDEKGDPRIELLVCNGSIYQTVYSNKNNYNYLKTFDPGDIIRFVEENDHVIKLVHLDFDFSEKTLNEKDDKGNDYLLAKNFTGGAGYVQGYLYGKYGTFMRLFEDEYQGDGIYRTNYTYSDLKGYPVSATYSIYVDARLNEKGDIRSLKVYRAGSGVMPIESRLTGDGRASYVVSLFRSGSTRSTVFYNITVE